MLPDENLAGAYAARLADQGYALVGASTRMGALMPHSFCTSAWLHAKENDLGLVAAPAAHMDEMDTFLARVFDHRGAWGWRMSAFGPSGS